MRVMNVLGTSPTKNAAVSTSACGQSATVPSVNAVSNAASATTTSIRAATWL